MRSRTEILASILSAEHHLRWASGNAAAMRFKASLPGVNEAEVAHLQESAKWFEQQAESAKTQICLLNDALLLLA